MGDSVHVKWNGKTLGIDVGGQSLLCGGLPTLAWRYAGETDWRWDTATVISVDTKESDRLAFILRLGPVSAMIAAVQGTDGGWTLSGELCSEAERPIELARFHYVQGTLAQDDKLLALTESRLFRRGEPLAPHRERLERLWASMSVAWPRLADPIHDEPDWAVATDVAVLLGDWNAPGLVVGFTGPGTAFGEIGLRTTDEPAFYIGVRLDNILVNPGERRTLEWASLNWGDWQAGLRQWAEQCARELGTRPVRAPMVGWCSWYQHYSGVRPEHVQQAAREFSAWPIPPGGRLIQIDDGFQVMPGTGGPTSDSATRGRICRRRSRPAARSPAYGWRRPRSFTGTRL